MKLYLSNKMHDVTTKKASILIDTVVTIWLRHKYGYNIVDAFGH